MEMEKLDVLLITCLINMFLIIYVIYLMMKTMYWIKFI